MHRLLRSTTAAAIAVLVSLSARAGNAQSGSMSKSDTTAKVPAQAGKLDDPTIVAIFDAANTWDMETGGLAARKGKSAEVRKFGRMLVKDHRMVRGQGRALAKKLKVTIDGRLSAYVTAATAHGGLQAQRLTTAAISGVVTADRSRVGRGRSGAHRIEVGGGARWR